MSMSEIDPDQTRSESSPSDPNCHSTEQDWTRSESLPTVILLRQDRTSLDSIGLAPYPTWPNYPVQSYG